MNQIAFHYSNRDHANGSVITAGRDSISILNAAQRVVEQAIRARLPNGELIRSSALYCWQTDRLVRNAWGRISQKYFYEVEIDAADILHRADLNYYTAATEAVQQGRPIDELVGLYCAGGDMPGVTARVELLVKKAIVKCRLLEK